MKTFKSWILFILWIGIGAIIVACNSGMGGDGNSNTTSVTSNITPETQDFSAAAQMVSPSGFDCFDIVNPTTNISKWYSSGEINIINNCSSNEKINNVSIIISSDNFSLDFKRFSFYSINGMYFPGTGGIYYAKPSMALSATTVDGLSAVAGTINIDKNVSAYIKPGNTIKISFGYDSNGKLPGAFSYDVSGSTPTTPIAANIQLSVDTTALKTVCTGKASCKIPLVITGQNNNFSSTIMTLTNSNIGNVIKTDLTNLNAGTYTISVANNSLPNGVTFSATSVVLNAGINANTTAIFKVVPTTGNISFTLVKPNITLINNNLDINLVNATNNEVAGNQLATYGKSGNFSNINVGNYSLISYGLADSKAGIYYAPLKQVVNVNANTTTNLGNISMSKVGNLVPLSVTVSGLLSGESITLTLTDSLNYIFTPLTLTNGTTQLQFVNGDNIVFNIATNTKYAAINPVSVIASKSDAISISVIPGSKLLSVNFNDNQIGAYTKADFIKNWGMSPNSSSGQSKRLKIVADPQNPNNLVLQLTYPAGEVGGNAGMTFTPTIGGKNTHLFFQYKVMFPSNFTWVKGGKLPGLTSSPDSPTGCIDNNSFDGFSARLMWRENGLLYSYLYNPVKVERCGDYYSLGTTTALSRGQWYTLTQEVQLNTPGLSDGYIKQWVDKTLVLDLRNLNLRKSGSIYIDQIKMDSFFGGSSDDWAPLTDQQVYFDDFMVSTSIP